MESTNHLRELYEDKDGFRKEEIANISGPNDFTEFYNRLKSVKDFHRQHPNQVCSRIKKSDVIFSFLFHITLCLGKRPHVYRIRRVEQTERKPY